MLTASSFSKLSGRFSVVHCGPAFREVQRVLVSGHSKMSVSQKSRGAKRARSYSPEREARFRRHLMAQYQRDIAKMHSKRAAMVAALASRGARMCATTAAAAAGLSENDEEKA